MVSKIQTRPASSSDENWLYQLYCATMRTHIEKNWGWVEQFQKDGFKRNLLPEKFKIVVMEGNDVGAYLVNEEKDHLWLEMLLIEPDMQRQGVGTQIMDTLRIESAKIQKPLKLNVIKVNPATEFYRRFGFKVYEEDEYFYKMRWDHA